MNHQINIDEAIAIAKEYHLKAEVTKCIKQCYLDLIIFIVTKQINNHINKNGNNK